MSRLMQKFDGLGLLGLVLLVVGVSLGITAFGFGYYAYRTAGQTPTGLEGSRD